MKARDDEGAPRLHLHGERSNHLIMMKRVEGAVCFDKRTNVLNAPEKARTAAPGWFPYVE